MAFEIDRENAVALLTYVACVGIRLLSVVCLGGVKGEEVVDTLVARLVVRFRGEGVKGMRPPAVFVEKML